MQKITDPILGNYFITTDENNFTVYEVITPKSGNAYDSLIGYYNSLEGALKSIAKHTTNTQSYTSIKDYIIELRNTYNDFSKHFAL